MPRGNRFLLPTLLSFVFIGLFSVQAKATSAILLSDRELIVSSRFIVKGVVRSVTPAWDDAHQMVWTYVEIECEEVLKGELTNQTIVLKQLGGDTGFDGVQVFGQPTFVKKQRVLLYLNTAPDGTLRVAHSFIGKFSIETNPQTGETSVYRTIPQGEVQIMARPSNEEEVTGRASLKDYVRKIRQILATDDGVELYKERYRDKPIVEMPEEYPRKRLAASDVIPNFTLSANGVRWMEADSGQAINFTLNPARSPVANGGAAEITRAMNAWPNQSGANISLRIAGETSSCGQQADGVNVISFGDCMNQLDLPVGCSGVVAQTNFRYTFETRTVGGLTFRRLVEADIVFNKGMDCFLGNSSNLAEIACHELGHAIGLGHSDHSAAIMWSVSHGGRDANLGDDDKAGALAIYPSTTGGGGGPVAEDNAAVITQNVPSSMNPGQSFAVSITLRNTGNTNWRDAVKLGSQNPADNSTWGVSRVILPNQVFPGQEVIIQFNVTAPSSPGTYNFQWRLVREGVGYFGASTPNVAIAVGNSGGGSGGTLQITSLSLADGVLNQPYKQTLTATGGVNPYHWQMASGTLPPGLTLKSGGSIEGTPTRAGGYSFALLVYDNSGNFSVYDGRRYTVTIAEFGNPSPLPIVTRIKQKGVKKLFVFGNNFSSNALILLNGATLTPSLFEQDGEIGLLVYKGRLEYRPTGENILQIYNQGNVSTAFIF